MSTLNQLQKEASPVYKQNKTKKEGQESLKQGSHGTEETYHLSKEYPDIVKATGGPEPPDPEEAPPEL